MIRPKLSVDQLEDRTTPVSLHFTTKLVIASVNTPPQDPMDNPPPAQPGTPTSPPTVSPPPPPASSGSNQTGNNQGNFGSQK